MKLPVSRLHASSHVSVILSLFLKVEASRGLSESRENAMNKNFAAAFAVFIVLAGFGGPVFGGDRATRQRNDPNFIAA
jgi:hypothetical protein